MAYVYVIVVDDDRRDCCKIGMANDVKARLSSLQSGSAHKLRCMYSWLFEDRAAAAVAESLAHSLLAEHRLASEWFALDGVSACVFIDEMLGDLGEDGPLSFNGTIYTSSYRDAGDDEPLVYTVRKVAPRIVAQTLHLPSLLYRALEGRQHSMKRAYTYG